MIKRLLLVVLLLGSLTASAQEGKINVLYLDGAAHEVQMSQVAKLTVADGNMMLMDKSGETVATHEINKVDKIELTGSATAINQLTKQSAITIRSNGYAITAEGMTDGKTLEVYTTGGSLVATAVAREGKATIDMAQLTTGVYVVKAEGQSLKVVKR